MWTPATSYQYTTLCSQQAIKTANEVVERSKERHNKNEYIYVARMPDVRQFNEKTFVGTFSTSTTKTRRRYLLHDVLIKSLTDWGQTPSELARDYLDIAYPHKLRATGEQVEAYNRVRAMPLYYRPFASNDAFYVDVRSAFWSIMSIVGWDVDYMPGKYLAPGRAPYDFPVPMHKVARNCLVSAGLANSVTVWTGSKFEETQPYNVHKNLGLWTCIADILHMIGCYAVQRCHAAYVNTDGYIVPGYGYERLCEYIQSLGLPYSVKDAGATMVTGVGSYRVGETQTHNFSLEYSMPYSNLYPVERIDMLEKVLNMVSRDRLDKPYRFRR